MVTSSQDGAARTREEPGAGHCPVPRRFRWPAACIVICIAALVVLDGDPQDITAQGRGTVAREHFVAVTDQIAAPGWDCPGIAIADSSSGVVVKRSGPNIAPPRIGYSSGQVAAASDGSLIVVQGTYHTFFYYLMMRDPDGRWVERGIRAPHTEVGWGGGAIEISPDDASLLASDSNRVLKYRTAGISTQDLGTFEAVTIDPTVEGVMPPAKDILPTAGRRTSSPTTVSSTRSTSRRWCGARRPSPTRPWTCRYSTSPDGRSPP
jgi:hypothetical protein